METYNLWFRYLHPKITSWQLTAQGQRQQLEAMADKGYSQYPCLSFLILPVGEHPGPDRQASR